MFTIVKSFINSNINYIKYFLIALVIGSLLYLGYDYSNTKSLNKELNNTIISKDLKIQEKDNTIKKNQEIYEMNISILNDTIIESERQKASLIEYNKKLEKIKGEKSNVKKDDTNFINRNIVEFDF